MTKKSEECEVAVVGAGAGGLAVARRLADAGRSVRVLEAGPFLSSSSFPTAQSNWQTAESERFSPLARVRRTEWDFLVNTERSQIEPAWFSGVGGSTLLYSGHYLRLREQDLQPRDYLQVAEWPFSYSDLTRHYEDVQQYVAVSGLEGDPAYPAQRSLLPPTPLGKLGVRLGQALNELNWHWWISPAAIATRPFRGQAACAQLGPCNRGCPQGAKSSADLTFLWNANTSLTVTSECQVTSLHERDGRIDYLEYRCCEGHTHQLHADRFILAANALGTPRLLLSSVSSTSPLGVANSSGQVGRNLMMHPLGYADGVFGEDLESNRGPQGCMLYSHQFYEPNGAEVPRSYTLHFLRGPWPVEAATTWFRRGNLKLGKDHFRSFRESFNRTAHVAIIVEDLPNPDNRIWVDNENLDRFGVAEASLEYQVDGDSRKALKHGLRSAQTVLERAGARETFGFGPVRNTGWHILGTCRMGSDPTVSVVNAWGRSHDVRNLYIADGSILPTGGAVNPAATIQALAFRVAEGILQEEAA